MGLDGKGTSMKLDARASALPLLVLCYALCAVLINAPAFATLLPVYAHQAVVFPMLLLPGIGIAALVRSPKEPMAFLKAGLRAHGLRLLTAVALFITGLAAFTTLKVSIPAVVPFYADPLLSQIDLALHHGDPGLFLHAILPDWVVQVVARLYGPVWFVYWFGMMALVTLVATPRLRRQYYWAMALSIALLGTVAAAAFSSVGPLFYELVYGDARYAGLVHALAESPDGAQLSQISGYLWRSYQSQTYGMGAGISAMPSMHLAIATLNAWTVTALYPRVAPLAWFYVAAILMGSMLLGWHYGVDGYFSIIAVCLIWQGLGAVFRRRSKAALAGEPVAAPLPDPALVPGQARASLQR